MERFEGANVGEVVGGTVGNGGAEAGERDILGIVEDDEGAFVGRGEFVAEVAHFEVADVAGEDRGGGEQTEHARLGVGARALRHSERVARADDAGLVAAGTG